MLWRITALSLCVLLFFQPVSASTNQTELRITNISLIEEYNYLIQVDVENYHDGATAVFYYDYFSDNYLRELNDVETPTLKLSNNITYTTSNHTFHPEISKNDGKFVVNFTLNDNGKTIVNDTHTQAEGTSLNPGYFVSSSLNIAYIILDVILMYNTTTGNILGNSTQGPYFLHNHSTQIPINDQYHFFEFNNGLGSDRVFIGYNQRGFHFLGEKRTDEFVTYEADTNVVSIGKNMFWDGSKIGINFIFLDDHNVKKVELTYDDIYNTFEPSEPTSDKLTPQEPLYLNSYMIAAGLIASVITGKIRKWNLKTN